MKQLRQKPLGDLNVLPTFLSETLGPSSDPATATAAELAPLLDGAGYKVKDQGEPDAPEGDDEADVPNRPQLHDGCQDGG